MVTISITAEAYAAIRSTLPKDVRAEPRLDEGGGFKIALDRHTLDRLGALRGPWTSPTAIIDHALCPLIQIVWAFGSLRHICRFHTFSAKRSILL
jgi:hypothetical protein